MVDCRPGAGAPPHELAHTQPNGGAPIENHNTQAGGSGDVGSHSIASPASVRSSTPASTNTLTTYTNAMNPGVGAPSNNGGYAAHGGGPGCAPYVCGAKGALWCGAPGPHVPPGPPGPPGPHGPHAPHAPLAVHMPPPPPPGVNPHVFKSVQPNGSDLPLNDIPTLRFYYNQGIDCVYGTYGAPPPPPPRHYSPRDLSQDMQQITLHDRPLMTHTAPEQNHKHKPGQPNDKPQINQGKGNGQRPLLGPRFKRGGGNQDGNQNNNHNKHNNNMGNKGPNNRRNSHGEARGPPLGYGAGEAECVLEQPLLTLPYIPYPPPMYPIQYYSTQYPVDTDPAMMGMMGGMSYVGYDEGVYEAGLQPYYPAPHYPPPHHVEHK